MKARIGVGIYETLASQDASDGYIRFLAQLVLVRCSDRDRDWLFNNRREPCR